MVAITVANAIIVTIPIANDCKSIFVLLVITVPARLFIYYFNDATSRHLHFSTIT
jgi:hypothetical protein